MTADALKAHLTTGATCVCRCWAVTRSDEVTLGFTDHDRELSFDGITFRADSGLTARALQQSTGLSVDNTEALGALSAPAITEADIQAGRFDGAEVRAWLVNWMAPEERMLQFRGSLGEITRSGEAFRCELRGLADALNQPRGRVYHPRCSAVLGDARCGVNLSQPGFVLEGPLASISDGRTIELADPGGFAESWFQRGRFEVLDGAAAGLTGVVKTDTNEGGMRRLTLWEVLRAPLAVGDRVRVVAGCDKRSATCRAKFSNILNFRGFPNIPGEDWLVTYPRRGGRNGGGSLG
ncbi:MAG: DUF2163 domain-containing protein [Pseudomonadota bacterium]